jgi:hypothetical protein
MSIWWQIGEIGHGSFNLVSTAVSCLAKYCDDLMIFNFTFCNSRRKIGEPETYERAGYKTLVVFSGAEAEEISRLLGISPTKTWATGDLIQKTQNAAKERRLGAYTKLSTGNRVE